MQIINEEINQQFKDELQLLSAEGGIRTVNPNVMTVYPINQHTSTYFKTSSATSSGSLTVVPCDPNKNFYLCGFSISYVKDATCDGTSVTLNVRINGTTLAIVAFELVPLTARNETIALSLPHPLKLDKNSSANFCVFSSIATFTAGTCTRRLSAWGYYA